MNRTNPRRRISRREPDLRWRVGAVLPGGVLLLAVVGMGMSYNEHLMRDYGAMTLASAVVLGAAVAYKGRTWTRVALAMYLTWRSRTASCT